MEKKWFRLTPLSVTLIYIGVASGWIYGLGHLVSLSIHDPVMIHKIELIKGSAFVIITGGILYFLVRQLYQRIVLTSNQLQSTLDAVPDLLFEVDLQGNYYDFHSPKTDLLAAPAEELIGKNIADVLPKEAVNICFSALQEADKNRFSGGKQFQLTLGESVKWFEISVAAKPSVDQSKRFIVLSRDISDRKEYEERIIDLSKLYLTLSQCNQSIVRSRNAKELFDTICQDTVRFGGMQLVWIGLLNSQNQTIDIESFFGNGEGYLRGLQISIDPSQLSGNGPTAKAFREDKSFWCQDFQHDTLTQVWHEKGREYGWGSSAAIPIHQNGNVVGVFSLYAHQTHAFSEEIRKLLEEMAMDISYALDQYEQERIRKAAEEKIHRMANFDELTGLPNRLQFEERIESMISLARRSSSEIAVLFFDLDHFKDINDSLGHVVGDRVLAEVARRLNELLREEDLIARLSGDEFIIALPSSSLHGASQVAQKLLDAFHHSFVVDNYELILSASIGITLYPNDGQHFETLYKNADIAMYRAKQEGRNGFCFFTEEMQESAKRTLEVGNALRYALDRGELELYYQPQISANDGKLIGFEALLRWFHPEFGAVSPAEFIPIAEENGSIITIGEWVLRTAVAQAKQWIDEYHDPIIMAVNISAIQFRSPNLPHLITSILEESGLPPEYLELELTESVTMFNPEKAIAIMHDLHRQGIRISIDDFGTGYSSLSYLKKFNVYKLKIDQSFVRDINVDDEDKAIVAAIIQMAKSLGLQTIAEGVETISQLEYLREQGCDEIQGYYYSKPLHISGIESFRISLNG